MRRWTLTCTSMQDRIEMWTSPPCMVDNLYVACSGQPSSRKGCPCGASCVFAIAPQIRPPSLPTPSTSTLSPLGPGRLQLQAAAVSEILTASLRPTKGRGASQRRNLVWLACILPCTIVVGMRRYWLEVYRGGNKEDQPCRSISNTLKLLHYCAHLFYNLSLRSQISMMLMQDVAVYRGTHPDASADEDDDDDDDDDDATCQPKMRTPRPTNTGKETQ